MTAVGPIGEEDLPALAALFAELVDEETDLTAMAASFRAMAADDAYILLGAKREGRLAGFIMGIVCRDIVGDCRPFLVVENVIVAASARGQGVGAALWADMEAEARRRGCHYCMLVSAAWREEAHAFYTGVGFETEKYKGFKKYLT